MQDWLRTLIKLSLLAMGIFLVYAIINGVVGSVNDKVQVVRDNDAGPLILTSSISATPFGPRIAETSRGEQIFYNMTIRRVEGEPCFVRTSWRWVLHMDSGNVVMWNKSDGQFYSGDKNENLAQAVQVPKELIPGKYTLSRLALFKCGSVEDYANTVRNTEIIVN